MRGVQPIDIESRVQALGRMVLEAADEYRPGPAERLQDWLLTHAVADQRFRSSLLRYLDVLASLDHDTGGREAKRLAAEYFASDFPELPRGLRWMLRVARNELIPARIVGESARRAAELFARRFITAPGPDTVRATTDLLREDGRYPSFDLLGEAVLSDREAEAYVARYLTMIGQLASDPAAGTETAGGVPALQVSLKLSSLAAHFSPIDTEGSIDRVRPGLETIVEAAREAGIGVTIDLEQYELRDLSWELFRRVFARGERLGDWPGAGIVLQAYLRDAEAHASDIIAFARERNTPFQIRLVKGAYWDYERINADASRWAPPVWTAKAETDATFEGLVRPLVEAYPDLHLAVGSHNVRAHAIAEATAEAAGLPAGAIEHQTLFRTAEGTSRAVASVGWVERDYVPVGELLPGMAYLVRRVLENSSQAGVLLQSRTGASPEELLSPPPAFSPVVEPGVERENGDFRRAPEPRWLDASFRTAFDQALLETRERWGEHFPMPELRPPLSRAETREVHSPSHPRDEPVGTVDFGDDAGAHRAVEIAAEGARTWSAVPVRERAAILERAADELLARGHDFAAWVVHEGGRDRAGAWGEVTEAVDFLRAYAAWARELEAEFGDRVAPRGVVAVIPPWNFSLAIPCGMTAAALVCGNAVVLKPAEQTPLVAARLARLLHEAGVPSDALICLPGRGDVVGAALAADPDVSMLAFTGSRAVGTLLHERIAEVEPAAGAGLRALVAEMGGKNPLLVFADADLDEAVDGILRSAFGHANQKCSAASRVLVEEPVYEALRLRVVEAARSLQVGPAEAAATQLNPVIDREAFDRLQREADIARAECSVLLDAFTRPEAPEGSLSLGPLLVELAPGAASSAYTTTNELFGPIVALIPFTDEEQAFRIANDTAFGLTAGVFSRSPRTIDRATAAIEAGNVYVNRSTTGARVGVEPFGGMKMSGTGPKVGTPEYLWAFLGRTDTPEIVEPVVPEPASREQPRLADEVWSAPFAERVDTIERAAVALGSGGHVAQAGALLDVTKAARRELGQPRETVQVAGQDTTFTYSVPRGLGLVRATSEAAIWWLTTPLLAGNGLTLFDSPELEVVVDALHSAGVPESSLRHLENGPGAMIEAAARPEVAFSATDRGFDLARELQRAMGPTGPGQRSLKALLSRFDGPQAMEPGFARRFAHGKVVAIRTLRHGAVLSLDGEHEEEQARGSTTGRSW